MKKTVFVAILMLFSMTAKNGVQQVSLLELEADLLERLLEEQAAQGYQNLMDEIGMSESSGRVDVVNQIGAIGKYQFMPRTLEDLGLLIRPDEFAEDPSLFPEVVQDSIMLEHLKRNEQYLQEIISQYEGDTLECGTIVTRAGILAAAHLAGCYGVERYFKEGHNPQDINGTSILTYLNKFQKVAL